MHSLTAYINGAIEELHHVRWPTRQQALRLSSICLVFCAAASVAFGLVDLGLSTLVKMMISLSPFAA